MNRADIRARVLAYLEKRREEKGLEFQFTPRYYMEDMGLPDHPQVVAYASGFLKLIVKDSAGYPFTITETSHKAFKITWKEGPPVVRTVGPQTRLSLG
ncbi:MAG: hypothetical protein QXQ87_09220 [Halobacteria archaeon]